MSEVQKEEKRPLSVKISSNYQFKVGKTGLKLDLRYLYVP